MSPPAFAPKLLTTLLPINANAITVQRLTGQEAADAYSKLGGSVKTTKNADGSLTLEFRGEQQGEVVRFTFAKEEFAKLVAKKGDKAAFNAFNSAIIDEAEAKLAELRKAAQPVPQPVSIPVKALQPTPTLPEVAMIEKVPRQPPQPVPAPEVRPRNVVLDIGGRDKDPYEIGPIPYKDEDGNKIDFTFRIATNHFKRSASLDLAHEVADRINKELQERRIKADWNKGKVVTSLAQKFDEIKADEEAKARGEKTEEVVLSFGNAEERWKYKVSFEFNLNKSTLRFRMFVSGKALNDYGVDSKSNDAKKREAIDNIAAELAKQAKPSIAKLLRHNPKEDEMREVNDAIRNFVKQAVEALTKIQVINLGQ